MSKLRYERQPGLPPENEQSLMALVQHVREAATLEDAAIRLVAARPDQRVKASVGFIPERATGKVQMQHMTKNARELAQIIRESSTNEEAVDNLIAEGWEQVYGVQETDLPEVEEGTKD